LSQLKGLIQAEYQTSAQLQIVQAYMSAAVSGNTKNPSEDDPLELEYGAAWVSGLSETWIERRNRILNASWPILTSSEIEAKETLLRLSTDDGVVPTDKTKKEKAIKISDEKKDGTSTNMFRRFTANFKSRTSTQAANIAVKPASFSELTFKGDSSSSISKNDTSKTTSSNDLDEKEIPPPDYDIDETVDEDDEEDEDTNSKNTSSDIKVAHVDLPPPSSLHPSSVSSGASSDASNSSIATATPSTTVTSSNATSSGNAASSTPASEWVKLSSTLLAGALRVANSLARGTSVLVHCSDGWDRTAQLATLAQLLLDPYAYV
jgi:Myotubularin-like phosphatase domain